MTVPTSNSARPGPAISQSTSSTWVLRREPGGGATGSCPTGDRRGQARRRLLRVAGARGDHTRRGSPEGDRPDPGLQRSGPARVRVTAREATVPTLDRCRTAELRQCQTEAGALSQGCRRAPRPGRARSAHRRDVHPSLASHRECAESVAPLEAHGEPPRAHALSGRAPRRGRAGRQPRVPECQRSEDAPA